jgi:hypothetical protein
VSQASYPPDSTEERGHQWESVVLDEMMLRNSDNVRNHVSAQLATAGAEL